MPPSSGADQDALRHLVQGSQAAQQPAHDKYPILEFFAYIHLAPHLQEISRPYADLAISLAERGSNHPQEVAAGLRKLLEAKDCAVRAAL